MGEVTLSAFPKDMLALLDRSQWQFPGPGLRLPAPQVVNRFWRVILTPLLPLARVGSQAPGPGKSLMFSTHLGWCVKEEDIFYLLAGGWYDPGPGVDEISYLIRCSCPKMPNLVDLREGDGLYRLGAGTFFEEDWFRNYLPNLNQLTGTSRPEIWRERDWYWGCMHRAGEWAGACAAWLRGWEEYLSPSSTRRELIETSQNCFRITKFRISYFQISSYPYTNPDLTTPSPSPCCFHLHPQQQLPPRVRTKILIQGRYKLGSKMGGKRGEGYAGLGVGRNFNHGYNAVQSVHWLINKSQMSRVECIFRSFDGAGSIFISAEPSLAPECLKQFACRALVTISQQRKPRSECLKLANLKQLSFKVDKCTEKLSPAFSKASQFIVQARKTTNIMIWSPQSRELAVVAAFTHLILRYGYSLEYIHRIYDQRILNVALSAHYIQQLKDLSKKQSDELETNEALRNSPIGKRILRIRRNYSELAKDSKAITERKKYETVLVAVDPNPESSRKGLSETDYFESCESEPSVPLRKRSSTGSEVKTHRKFLSAFDFAF